jgi:hypothetical protein
MTQRPVCERAPLAFELYVESNCDISDKPSHRNQSAITIKWAMAQCGKCPFAERCKRVVESGKGTRGFVQGGYIVGATGRVYSSVEEFRPLAEGYRAPKSDVCALNGCPKTPRTNSPYCTTAHSNTARQIRRDVRDKVRTHTFDQDAIDRVLLGVGMFRELRPVDKTELFRQFSEMGTPVARIASLLRVGTDVVTRRLRDTERIAS